MKGAGWGVVDPGPPATGVLLAGGGVATTLRGTSVGLVAMKPEEWIRASAPAPVGIVRDQLPTVVAPGAGSHHDIGGCRGDATGSFIYRVVRGDNVGVRDEGLEVCTLDTVSGGLVSEDSGVVGAPDPAASATRRVADHFAGQPNVDVLLEQRAVRCPQCASTMGLPGSFVNPLDFRYRCSLCAWVWCDWETESTTWAWGHTPRDLTVWLVLLWGRVVVWSARPWLQVWHGDTLLGAVALEMALALRDLVAHGPRLARTEVGVMWSIVAWLHANVMGDGVYGVGRGARGYWCADWTADGSLLASLWEGPSGARASSTPAQDEGLSTEPLRELEGDEGSLWEDCFDNDGHWSSDPQHQDTAAESECPHLKGVLRSPNPAGTGDTRVGVEPGGHHGEALHPRLDAGVSDLGVQLCSSTSVVPPGRYLAVQAAHHGRPEEASIEDGGNRGLSRSGSDMAESPRGSARVSPPGEGGTAEGGLEGSAEGRRFGAWHGHRSRSERVRQQQEVGDLPGQLLSVVGMQLLSWTGVVVVGLAGAMPQDWWPWPTCHSFPGQVWDVTVGTYEQERASQGVAWSPDTPVSAEGAQAAATSLLRATAIWEALEGHPQRSLMAHGAMWGFPLMAQLAPQHTEFGGKLRGPEQVVVDEWGDKMIAAGKVVHVEPSALPALVVTPFVVVAKEGSAGRVCHDLSAGGVHSVNASMDTAPFDPVQLPQPGDFVTQVQHLGVEYPGERVVAFRLDLAAYFNQLPLRVRDAWLTGQRHRGRVFVHRFATFGGSSTPGLASAVSNTVCDLMAKAGFYCRVFLDDFICITVVSRAAEALAYLRGLLAMFGLVENQRKLIGPSDDLVILGVRYVFSQGQASVSEERVPKVLAQLELVAGAKTVLGSQLRKLCGVLSFVSAVVPWGRAHISPLWQALSTVHQGHHHLNVSAGVRRACEWWRAYLLGQLFTTSSFLVGRRPEQPLIVVVGVRCDASTEWGWGMISEPHSVYARGQWSEAEAALLGIVVLEGLAALFTLICVGPMVGGMQVVLQSDNAGLVFMLLKEHSRDARLCALLQAIVAVQELYGFRLLVGHTSTRFMGEPDDMSRGVLPSRCLPPCPGGWHESLMCLTAQQLSCDALGSLQRATSLGREVAVQRWVSSISSLTGSLLEGRASRPRPWVPFVPFRQWAVVINESAHRLSIR